MQTEFCPSVWGAQYSHHLELVPELSLTWDDCSGLEETGEIMLQKPVCGGVAQCKEIVAHLSWQNLQALL